MDPRTDKQPSVLRSLDWWTIAIYLCLLIFGWISVCGASYTYGETDIFSLSTRSGMQIVWIATSIVLGFVILMMDESIYDTFSYVIYGALLLLLFATIFNPHEIKGLTFTSGSILPVPQLSSLYRCFSLSLNERQDRHWSI